MAGHRVCVLPGAWTRTLTPTITFMLTTDKRNSVRRRASASQDNGHAAVVRALAAAKATGQQQQSSPTQPQSSPMWLDMNQSRTDDGATPLYGACFAGHVEVVAALLQDNSVDINRGRMVDGTNPFHIACDLGHVDVVKLLLATGRVNANQTTTDNGATPLYMACEDGHAEVVRELLMYNKEIGGALNQPPAAPAGLTTRYPKRTFANCAVDVNIPRWDNGDTPLYIAAYSGHLNVVNHLLACEGVQCNKARTADEETPLFVACFHEHFDVRKSFSKKKNTIIFLKKKRVMP